jgi:hypothetical protein
MSKEALKLALEWIEKQPEETPHSKYDVDTRYVVIRELEAALAQPEQREPTKQEHMKYKETLEKIARVNAMDYEYQAWAKEALAQPEQEYGVVAGIGKGVEIPACVKYYYIELKLPPQRTWVDLTEEERGICINANMGTGLWAMAKDIEAKLKEKNGI